MLEKSAFDTLLQRLGHQGLVLLFRKIGEDVEEKLHDFELAYRVWLTWTDNENDLNVPR